MLRHHLGRFYFDGYHNRGGLDIVYEDEFSDTDDSATHFDGDHNRIWKIHTTTSYTTTILNLFTHDTRTQTGTFTNSYNTRKRNHQMRFTHTIPVSFRQMNR